MTHAFRRFALPLLAFLASSGLPASAQWANTGSMAMARHNHSATLLPSGRILVAGGADVNGNPTSSCETYDPATGLWSGTASLGSDRYFHTATLLPSGMVLVVGGINTAAHGATASCELYDPASGTWSATGSLLAARAIHTATLLGSGRVLVVGGGTATSATALDSCELYDPATGTWSSTGSLYTGRADHTATLLDSGSVLAIGGSNDGTTPLDSCEVYDPTTGTWTVNGVILGRMWHTATLLGSGQVLVTGGLSPANIPYASCQLYDVASFGGATTGSFNARAMHTATRLPSGKVLAVGVPAASSGAPRSSTQTYDPSSGTWSASGNMTTGRFFHTATLLSSGEVVVAGGITASGATATCERYTVASAAPSITSPVAGSTLSSSSATFTWSAGSGVSQYWLWVGSTPGGNQYYNSNEGNLLSATVTTLPTNGSAVYARLWYLTGSGWAHVDAAYTATSAAVAPVLTSPTPGSALSSSSATFAWSAGAGVTQYWLYVGSAPGGYQYYDSNEGSLLSATVTTLPTDGSTVYVRLWYLASGTWRYLDASYTAANQGGSFVPPAITSPTAGSTLAGTTVTFAWSAGVGVAQYWLYVGSTRGGFQYVSQNEGTNLSATVHALPSNGSAVQVRLWYLTSGVWGYVDTTYTAVRSGPSLTSPAPGSTLTSSTATFTWTAGSGVTGYWLYVGSCPGCHDLFSQDEGMDLSATVRWLPTDGRTLYVRLWYWTGTWQYTDETYTAAVQ